MYDSLNSTGSSQLKNETMEILNWLLIIEILDFLSIKEVHFCFGSNAGGNVYSFLMDYQKIPFPDAVKVLAEQYNIPIELNRSEDNSELYSSLYKLHEIAMDLYQENLFSNVGEKSLAYLKERGFGEDIIKQFKIGLSLIHI